MRSRASGALRLDQTQGTTAYSKAFTETGPVQNKLLW